VRAAVRARPPGLRLRPAAQQPETIRAAAAAAKHLARRRMVRPTYACRLCGGALRRGHVFRAGGGPSAILTCGAGAARLCRDMLCLSEQHAGRLGQALDRVLVHKITAIVTQRETRGCSQAGADRVAARAYLAVATRAPAGWWRMHARGARAGPRRRARPQGATTQAAGESDCAAAAQTAAPVHARARCWRRC
jgi:hypothetical protein